MTPFVIFLLVVTFLYIIYYAVIITIDLNSKPKGDGKTSETIETGMDDQQPVNDNPDDTPYTEENEHSDEGEQGKEESDADHSSEYEDTPEEQDEDNVTPSDPYKEETPSIPHPTPDDDDIYGLGDGDDDGDKEQGISRNSPDSPEESNESSDEIEASDDTNTKNEADSESHQGNDNPQGEEKSGDVPETSHDNEAKAREAELIAQQQGAQIVEPMDIDETDYSKEPEKKMGVTHMYEPADESSKVAEELNNTGEPILAESTTPVTDLHSETMLGAMGMSMKRNITKL